MYNRKIKLIRALLGHERMSSAELMDKLDISQRTLRNEVKEINEILRQENVGIYSSNTGGYYLKAEDEGIVTATTEYSTHIHASVEQGNVFACQFGKEQ